jgi:hypothetical protein
MITVHRNPPAGHAISRAGHIAGVTHEITPDNWIVTWPLWSASLYVTAA